MIENLPKTTSPNILVIFTDQQRWDTVGCYGQPDNITPNLDEMASEGVQFEYAFSNQPVCGPTRACLQTGKYPTEIGCHVNNRMLPLDEKTIAHYMADQGYEVGYIGKWHLASSGGALSKNNFRKKPVSLERRGGYKDFWLAADVLEFTSHGYGGHMFDQDMQKRVFPDEKYRVDVLTDWTLEYLQERDKSNPFFFFLSYLEPHHQNNHFRYEGPRGSETKFKNFHVPGDLKDNRGDWKQNYSHYLGAINSIDSNLGRIRETLKELGMLENTLIIFTSDHGSHFRTRNSEYKRSCHDSSIRVPMIFNGPGFTGGNKISQLVSLMDIPPTILMSGGITPPSYMHGLPLQAITQKNSKNWPETIYIQISESQCGRAIRTKKWKYSIKSPKGRKLKAFSKIYREDCLYDLETDPFELKNLVDDENYEEIRVKLREKILQKMQEAGEPPAKIVTQ